MSLILIIIIVFVAIALIAFVQIRIASETNLRTAARCCCCHCSFSLLVISSLLLSPSLLDTSSSLTVPNTYLVFTLPPYPDQMIAHFAPFAPWVRIFLYPIHLPLLFLNNLPAWLGPSFFEISYLLTFPLYSPENISHHSLLLGIKINRAHLCAS